SADDVANRFFEIDGARVQKTARLHVDSGLLTILAKCGVGGLRALAQDGSWCSVPVCDDSLAVNFGGLMELWTGGRI
ncbi:MAG: 2OG-Fe(II) oxygenase family protein, partial [Pseudomonadota bacterium]|nr:2OG-Fe(II) oxygenase family protein [Pseudomonadota bacterium]